MEMFWMESKDTSMIAQAGRLARRGADPYWEVVRVGRYASTCRDSAHYRCDDQKFPVRRLAISRSSSRRVSGFSPDAAILSLSSSSLRCASYRCKGVGREFIRGFALRTRRFFHRAERIVRDMQIGLGKKPVAGQKTRGRLRDSHFL